MSACPDGGTCHHGCSGSCWRVDNAGPLSGVYPGDVWPEEPDATLVSLVGLADQQHHGYSQARPWPSVALLEGLRDDGATILIAAEPRLAAAALAALDDGAPVEIEVEPWQVWRVITP